VRNPTAQIALFAALSAVLLTVALEVDLPWLEQLNVYGNFDAGSKRSFVTYLWPGTADAAIAREYRFDRGVHAAPLLALGVVFALFLFLRVWRHPELRLGIARGLTGWAAFVIARFGVLRVSGALPVRRCTYGELPFLNCQACEMASGGCPIGSLQAALMRFRFPLLPFVVLLLAGLSLGRWICGWICPFGLLSDIFDRISKHTVRPRVGWTALKFVFLGLVVAVPLGMGLLGGASWLPFCATICPSGSVYGLLPFYATSGAREFAAAFTPGRGEALLAILFHGAVLAVFIWLAVKVTGRVFCKYVCPLGAFLGLLNPIAFVRVVHEEEGCTDCGKCAKKCPVGVQLSRADFLTESNCIRCGRCVKVCPGGARKWVFGWGGKASKEAGHGR
jgi:ferredoxin